MSKLDYNKIFIKDACPTKMGGQAIMEGVMMQGEDRVAMAMRLPSGELYLKTKKKPEKKAWTKIPLIRGCVNFFTSLISGTEVLMESADILEKYAPEEYGEPEGKFEKWLNDKFGEKTAWNLAMALSVILAFVFSLALFVILPTWVVNGLKHISENAFFLNLVEGILRIAMFVLYIFAVSKMEDIKKVFQYHGAEHKTIHCFENNLKLTPGNAQTFPTLHPRCGTSFLMFVFIIALLLFSFLGWPNLKWRIISRLLLLPVIAGVSYELLRWAGREDNKLIRVLSYPGLMMQKITTAEPSLEQLEVAIISLKAVMVSPDTPVGEGFVDENGNWLDDFDETKFIESKNETEKAEEEVTIGAALRWGQEMLKDTENGAAEAKMILCYAGRLSQSELITKAKEKLNENDFSEYKIRIKQRLQNKPLQYIVGTQEFFGRLFKVNSSVLIPRLDTEVLVEKCIDILREKGMERAEILDMCTGSGVIGITVAGAYPNAHVTMTDISEDALKVAITNAKINKVSAQCSFSKGDMFAAIPEDAMYDMLICNPPYIESAEINNLDLEVKNFEPRMALDGGIDGLAFYRIIAKEAAKHINPGGYIVLEIGDKQAQEVKALLIQNKEFNMVQVIRDLARKDRVVVARRVI